MMQLLVREGYGVNVVLITIDRGPPVACFTAPLKASECNICKAFRRPWYSFASRSIPLIAVLVRDGRWGPIRWVRPAPRETPWLLGYQ